MRQSQQHKECVHITNITKEVGIQLVTLDGENFLSEDIKLVYYVSKQEYTATKKQHNRETLLIWETQ